MSAPEFATTTHELKGNLGRGQIEQCAMCRKGVMHGGAPMFFRLTVERFYIDAGAVVREHGMELMMGSPALAAVFSDGRALAKRVTLPGTLTVCLECAISKTMCVGALEEMTGRAETDSVAEDAR